MICQKCLRRLARHHPPPPSSLHPTAPSRRPFHHSTPLLAQAVTAQTTTATQPRPHDLPAATSTSAAQPFSTPLTPAPDKDLAKKAAAAAAASGTKSGTSSRTPSAPKVQSSVPAGTVLKGLNFIKGQADPVALEDHEYPAWLWGVLEGKAGGGLGPGGAGAGGEGDLFSKSKKQRRVAAKALRKQQLLNPEALAPKVPIYEQSVDLPSGGDGVESAKDAEMARKELTQAMREKRRSQIKEDNFLKEMR